VCVRVRMLKREIVKSAKKTTLPQPPRADSSSNGANRQAAAVGSLQLNYIRRNTILLL